MPSEDDDWKMMKGNSEWFEESRFGLFIHWGLYSMAARHEWAMTYEAIPPADYRKKYFERFDPDLYNPDAWAEAAKSAGMGYAILTAKHHEGFCLWDTEHTDYKSTRLAAGRDYVSEFMASFRKAGMNPGLYYSLIDWDHPDYLLDSITGPYMKDPDARARLNQGRQMERYTEYLHDQVCELLTKYDPSILWCDFSYKHKGADGKGRESWDSDNLLRKIRELQPDILLNDRLDIPYGWDIKSPEQFQPREPIKVGGKAVTWEACQNFAESWGYYRDEGNWREPREILLTLIDTVAKDGNLLLNIGPNARGEFPPGALERLQYLGTWMRLHDRSIKGCGAAPEAYTPPDHSTLTYNKKTRRLYIHMHSWPYRHLHLPGKIYRDTVKYAQFLNDGSEVKFTPPLPVSAAIHAGVSTGFNFEDSLILDLPMCSPPVEVPVIELFLEE